MPLSNKKLSFCWDIIDFEKEAHRAERNYVIKQIIGFMLIFVGLVLWNGWRGDYLEFTGIFSVVCGLVVLQTQTLRYENMISRLMILKALQEREKQ